MQYDKLKDALDGLLAYHVGATDSGIHDERLRAEVQTYLSELPYNARRRLLAAITKDLYLSASALDNGYGPADVREFLNWLEDDLDVPL
jgi:hypothetical protein